MVNLIPILIVVFLCGNILAVLGENPIVKAPLGPVKGTVIQSILGKTIYAFRGIRYAKAPVNELRFQPPVPVEPWTNIYDATENGAACPQPEMKKISEDCLFLNVFSTQLSDNQQGTKHPVFVFIHPGGFYSGSTEWARPEYFLDKDVVLVTLQYRLASLGFLSTGDHLAPGNNGLKDQVLALKWVKNNIAAFGGDPNLVTIAGYSCGGSSVSLHMVSPMSKGLFHRAVIMSGSSYGNWPVPEEQFSLAQKQARFVDCPDDTSANIINCLKTKSAEQIGNTLYSFDEFGYEPIIMWYPVIERDFGQERFLTEDPAKSIQCGKFEQVPVIITVTKDEFSAQSIYILENSTIVQELNDNFEKVAPIAFIYERDTENSKYISQELKQFYFGNARIDNQTRSGLEKIFADGIIGFTAHRSADLLASKSTEKVFYYLFEYQGRFSHTYVEGTQTPYGVVHHDDLLYIFCNPYFPRFNFSTPEYKVASKLTNLLANFAKTGNPTPTQVPLLDNIYWEPYTLEHKKYLDITDKLLMKENLFKERYDVWDKVFPLPRCDQQ